MARDLTTKERFEIFSEADDRWSAALRRRHGAGADAARFTADGKAGPELAALYDARSTARDLWRASLDADLEATLRKSAA